MQSNVQNAAGLNDHFPSNGTFINPFVDARQQLAGFQYPFWLLPQSLAQLQYCNSTQHTPINSAVSESSQSISRPVVVNQPAPRSNFHSPVSQAAVPSSTRPPAKTSGLSGGSLNRDSSDMTRMLMRLLFSILIRTIKSLWIG